MSVTIASFIICLVLIILTGALSALRKRKSTEDYFVASRKVPPWLTSLSTVATNNSGFMFIGMIAYTYRAGLESLWMMAGWITGDFIAWLFVHPRVRRLSKEEHSNSIPGLIGTLGGKTARPIIVAAAVVTVVFLGVYAAGQLKAGSTALHALFDWDMRVGMFIGAAVVVVYSFAGGIRADIWTDATQSFIMLVSMMMILAAGVMDIGGPSALLDNLEMQDPALANLYPENPAFGLALFVLGYLFAGFGVVGQPHVMTRLMALDSSQSIRRAGFYYFSWFLPFFLASIAVGLYCRAILPDLAELPIAEGLREPTELALPLLTRELLPDVFVGIALAGLFAATISTADSQIIVCSAALTQDIAPRWRSSYLASKLGTFSIAAFSLSVALYAPEGVFGLVLIAWSALAASLGPLLVLKLYAQPVDTPTALAMMTAAVATVSLWHLSPYNDDVFKALPGTLAALIVYGASRASIRLAKYRRG